MQNRQQVRGRIDAESVSSARPVGEPITSPAGDGSMDRADTDEMAADAARRRYRQGGLEPLEPDSRIRPLLAPDELVLAISRSVVLDPPQHPSGADQAAELSGDLYVTSDRLLLIGRGMVAFFLDDIEDATLSGERILLVLRDGIGVTVQADRPRLLRVQISTARAARAGSANRSLGGAQSSSR